MDHILDPRVPKGGTSSGFKYKGGNSGGGGDSNLPWWAWLIIVFGIVWIFVYFWLFHRFFRKEYTSLYGSDRPRFSAGLVGRVAWKAFKYATPIQPVIWLNRKIRGRKGEATKKVGGSFYRKVDDVEKGINNKGSPAEIPPAQLRHQPPSPISHPSPADR